MKTKLTQGPWAIYNTSGKILIETVKHTIEEPRVYIAMQEDGTEADCRLIAAAPEMLEALEFIVNRLDLAAAESVRVNGGEENYMLRAKHPDLRALIKKVKGE